MTAIQLNRQLIEIDAAIACQQKLAASLCRKGQKEKARAARTKLHKLLYQRDLLLVMSDQQFALNQSTNDNAAGPTTDEKSRKVA